MYQDQQNFRNPNGLKVYDVLIMNSLLRQEKSKNRIILYIIQFLLQFNLRAL
jgi:hypothetical protein